MKILLIASRARSLSNFRGPLIRELLERGYEVAALVPSNGDDRHVRRLNDLGVEVHNVAMDRAGAGLWGNCRSLAAMTSLVWRIRPEVVLAYTIKPITLGLLACAVSRVRRRYALITGLGYTFSGECPFYVNLAAKLMYGVSLRFATGVFFQNHDDERLFRRLRLVPRSAQVKVVNGSGVDLDHFLPSATPMLEARFLLIARLLKAKGIREFVDASRAVFRQRPDAKFRVVGWVDSGNPDSISSTELGEWSREGIVEFVGEVEDVRSQLEWCSVYVLPSYREGTPRSVLEGMAVGRAVITTDVPGCRETVVQGENGFLVPARDPRPLAEAMMKFVENPLLAARMGERSRELAVSKYDVRKVNVEILAGMGLTKRA